ncbi:MAG: OadG family protein [Anaerovoracaceae bacterium]
MKDLSLMERFANPDLFKDLSFIDKLQGGLVTTLMGLGITFVVLTLIWGVISIMSRIINQKPEPQNETILVTEDSPVTINKPVSDGEVNPQLVAVIMAAIAASEGSEYVSDLVVRKISRVSGSRPVWGTAGNTDSIESRKF